MKIKNKKLNVWLLFAIIFGTMSIAINLFAVILINTNLFGFQDLILNFLYGSYPSIDMSSQIIYESISLLLVALINFLYTVTYFKGIKYGINSPIFASVLVNRGIWQILIASPLAGICALIAGLKMKKVVAIKPKEEIKTAPATEGEISQYKLVAMSEAVERLKQLKESGAISEEEYYANLNRILEG